MHAYVSQVHAAMQAKTTTFSTFACWFQPELISHGTIFFSHNKSAPVELINPETDQRSCCLKIHTSRERTSAYYNPNNAPPTLLSNSNDQHLLIIYNGQSDKDSNNFKPATIR